MKTEPSEKGNPYLAARRAEKATLLPRAAQLAGEGRTYQEIADALGIAKSTVCDWLRGRPLERAAVKALGMGADDRQAGRPLRVAVADEGGRMRDEG